MNDLHEMSSRARRSFLELSVSPAGIRNKSLIRLAEVLRERADDIFSANKDDLERSGKENYADHR